MTLGCQKTEYNHSSDYLKIYTGTYEGTSDHWYWVYVNGGQTSHTYKNVRVNVLRGKEDSCLTMEFIYDDTIYDIKENLSFSDLGIHHSYWGAGSSHGSLDIQFSPDSMHYDYLQYQGLGSHYGIIFNISKVE